MLAVIGLLLVLSLSILVTRIATIALVHTGLSRETARFQARSAFTGVGFTTRESEMVVNHPVRRRILFTLMLFGNAGIVTAMASLILTFVGEGIGRPWLRVAMLMAGLALLWWAANSRLVDRRLSNLISWALRRYTRLVVRDYAGLLHLGGEYRISELQVQPGDWLDGKRLGGVRLRDEGVIVLAVTRPGGLFLGAPDGETEVTAGDVLILYARGATLDSLDRRPRDMTGEVEHRRAVVEHEEKVEAEKNQDRVHREASPPQGAS